MEALVVALIATGNMYRQQKVSVPEPAKFEAFDLQALRLPDQNKHDSQGRPFDGPSAAAGQALALLIRRPEVVIAGFILVGFGLSNLVPIIGTLFPAPRF